MIEVTAGLPAADLIPGNPDQVEQLAARLTRFAHGAGTASVRLTTLDSVAWSGLAAELFAQVVGDVPAHLGRAGSVFAVAARALSEYAEALREAQAEAAEAVRMVEQSTAESAAADQAAAQLRVQRARDAVAEAGQLAAARLADLTAIAPPPTSDVASSGGLPTVRFGGVTIHASTEHTLAQPDQLLAPLDAVVDDVRFDRDHSVDFAGASQQAEATNWQDWVGQRGAERSLGSVQPAMIAAIGGLGIAGMLVIGRRRRQRTALTVAGISDAELRRRRRAGFRDAAQPGSSGSAGAGLTVPVRAVTHGTSSALSSSTWRTRLASPPRTGGTVHVWAGPEANPLSRSHDTGAVPMVSGSQSRRAVLRSGPPPEPGAGAEERS
jgi:hypothetical protein